MARRDAKAILAHIRINNPSLSKQATRASREPRPPREKDGPGARIAYEEAVAAHKQAQAEAAALSAKRTPSE